MAVMARQESEEATGDPSPNASAQVRTVYLLDDHERVRVAVAELLEATHEFQVVGQAGTVAEAARDLLGRNLQADVAVFDVTLTDGDGLDLCARITEQRRDLAVVVFTARDDPETVARSEAAGARALVVKQLRSNGLLTALREAMAPPA